MERDSAARDAEFLAMVATTPAGLDPVFPEH
jgi:hypothetical protein